MVDTIGLSDLDGMQAATVTARVERAKTAIAAVIRQVSPRDEDGRVAVHCAEIAGALRYLLAKHLTSRAEGEAELEALIDAEIALLRQDVQSWRTWFAANADHPRETMFTDEQALAELSGKPDKRDEPAL
ncbi:hypothetical protein SAMN05519104_4391 [Rhizobiales bacterium GAS188]|nr:hypothetical protein SAMN05519104_4391 [Rhizobiales bacterium GAS188]